MKNLKLFGVIALFLFAINAINAQKFGHVDSQKLLSIMPETAEAQKKIEAYVTDIRDQLDVMEVEYNNKLKNYQETVQTLSEVAREAKEQELTDLMRRVQEFEQSASGKIQNKQAEIFEPIRNKALKAIEAVGKENGFLYVFDIGSGVLLYYSDKSEDILPMVKTKLGIN